MEKKTVYQGMISDNLAKVLKKIVPFYTEKIIVRHYITDIFYVHFEYGDGTNFIAMPVSSLPKCNICFSRLWIDKDIAAEIVKEKILPKFIGREKDITRL